LSLLTIQKFT